MCRSRLKFLEKRVNVCVEKRKKCDMLYLVKNQGGDLFETKGDSKFDKLEKQ
jgi:hypothetical protein